MHDGKIIKVLETKVSKDGNGKPGEIVRVTKEGIDFGCGSNCVTLIKVKPEGKGEMFARDWYNGLKNR